MANTGFPDVQDALPPLTWGFEDVDEPPLPPLNSPLPALVWGFEGMVDEPPLPPDSPPANSAPPLPALVWGFEGVDVPPGDVDMDSLLPLNFGFQETFEDEDDAAMDEALPPLDLGFREHMKDELKRAHDLMERAINKLDELNVEENPARDHSVRNQIQVCFQMQALYVHMAMQRRSTRALLRTTHMVRTAGPEHME